MADIILDTNILADLLIQYFKNGSDQYKLFESEGFLNEKIVQEINKIILWHEGYSNTKYPGLVVVSAFAFVEISRKFDEIIKNQFTIEQFGAFIEEHPEWFIISTVDNTLQQHFKYIPREIVLQNGDVKPIEWADAIHIATAESRDEPWFLAASDLRIRAIENLLEKVI